jgi:hypothetical protein
MQIRPDVVWHDASIANVIFFEGIIDRFFRRGFLRVSQRRISRCRCQAVEFLSEAENFSKRRRVYSELDGKLLCKKCGSEVEKFVEDVVLFRFPWHLSFNVYPKFYEKEIGMLFEGCVGKEFMVSRQRKEAIPLKTPQGIFRFDADFVWQLYLLILDIMGYRVEYLVGSNHSLLACLFTIALSKIINPSQEITLVIPPYFYIQKGESLKNNVSFRNNTFSIDPKVWRLLIASALNWQKKESVINIANKDLIAKMSYRIVGSSLDKAEKIQQVMSRFNFQSVRDVLASIRKNRDIYVGNQLYGII